ncbi:Erythrocyte membrane binding protein [Staphylococcus aureus]|nr:Erythrocyte membrane binding protein [Staphylococcus aureus]
MTSATSKTINLLATDTSGNTATTSFNVTVKPLRDKYRVGTSSTAANPVRIANISNNATVSQADQTAIINSLTLLKQYQIEVMQEQVRMKSLVKQLVMSVVLEIMPMLQ